MWHQHARPSHGVQTGHDTPGGVLLNYYEGVLMCLFAIRVLNFELVKLFEVLMLWGLKNYLESLIHSNQNYSMCNLLRDKNSVFY